MALKAIQSVALKHGYLAYRDEVDAAIRRVLESGFYILGREVLAFEEAFAEWCQVQSCVGVGNGTDAISLALRSLQVGPGDVVFTVSHTAVATVAGIELAGARPVLIDVAPESLTIDPEKLESTIRALPRDAGRPRAVVAVHLYGHACDLGALRDICDRHELFLIEDCAQAHGGSWNGKRLGSWGDVACFSFYPTKNLGAFGDGGAVLTSNAEVAARCRALREYGWSRRYDSELAGMNSRLDELQAAILSVRLAHLEEEIAARRAVALKYDLGLSGYVLTPVCLPGNTHAYHLYVIRSPWRDALHSYLHARGIQTAIHYPLAVHQQAAYSARLPIGYGGMVETERAVKEVLSLPMHPFLSNADATTVISCISDWALKVNA